MRVLLPVIIGLLYATGIYLILRRSMVKVIFGLVVLGHAANLMIFTVGRLTKGSPAFVPHGATGIAEPFADPLPQALILTAIVIGFGIQAFTIALFKKTCLSLKTEDLDEMRNTDQLEKESP